MGGASALLGVGPIDADAFILESVFPTIKEAVQDRLAMRFGWLGSKAAPLLYWQIPWQVDVSLDALKPIAAIKKIQVPVFIISGMEDKHTTAAETQRLFAAANEPKKLWLVAGAKHQDILLYDESSYQAKVLEFIRSLEQVVK